MRVLGAGAIHGSLCSQPRKPKSNIDEPAAEGPRFFRLRPFQIQTLRARHGRRHHEDSGPWQRSLMECDYRAATFFSNRIYEPRMLVLAPRGPYGFDSPAFVLLPRRNLLSQDLCTRHLVTTNANTSGIRSTRLRYLVISVTVDETPLSEQRLTRETSLLSTSASSMRNHRLRSQPRCTRLFQNVDEVSPCAIHYSIRKCLVTVILSTLSWIQGRTARSLRSLRRILQSSYRACHANTSC